MNPLKLACQLLPLLTILCFSQRSTDTEYHLVKFVDKTPYIIITSQGILSDVLKSIHSVKFYSRQFEQDPQLFSYSLDTTRMQLPEELDLFYGFSYSPRVAQKIKGPHDNRNRLTNSRYVLQFALPGGNGKQVVLEARSAWYYPIFSEGFIIVQCKPLEESPYPVDGFLDYLRAVPPAARCNISWRKDIPRDNLSEVPESIQKQVKQLSTDFLNSLESYRKRGDSTVNDVTEDLVAIRYYDGQNSAIYFAALTSYGSKYYESSLWLLDSNGKIVQHIVGRRYIHILGKTDLNRDGTHELTVQYSIGDYSGGIEVLNLEDMVIKHPILQSKTSLELWWD